MEELGLATSMEIELKEKNGLCNKKIYVEIKGKE